MVPMSGPKICICLCGRKEKASEKKRERESSYRGEGIHLDGGLGLWRAGNVKLESGDSQQHNQKLP